MESQNENEFDLKVSSDDERIIDRMHYKKDIRVRIKTMRVIKNLPVPNVDIHESLLSRLPIRDSSVVSSSTGSSGKITDGRRKGERNKITVDKIEKRLTDCSSPTQQILTIKATLKDPIFSEQGDQVDIINTE